MLSLEKAIFDNEKLIYSIASKFKGNDIEDLFQVGVLGLMKAYENYDEKHNTKFSSYSYMYIFGEINDYVRTNKSIKISRIVNQNRNQIFKAKEEIEQTHRRPASITQIAALTGIPIDNIIEAESISEVRSLDYEYSENGDKSTSLIDLVSVENKNYDDILTLQGEIEKLDKIERDIIDMRYYKDYTQSETAKILNMSQVQVSRNEAKILKMLGSRCA